MRNSGMNNLPTTTTRASCQFDDDDEPRRLKRALRVIKRHRGIQRSRSKSAHALGRRRYR